MEVTELLINSESCGGKKERTPEKAGASEWSAQSPPLPCTAHQARRAVIWRETQGDPLPHVPNFSGDSPAGRGEGLVEIGWEGARPQLGPRRGPELHGGAGRVNRSPTSPLSPPERVLKQYRPRGPCKKINK